jgi:hypothetical protein
MQQQTMIDLISHINKNVNTPYDRIIVVSSTTSDFKFENELTNVKVVTDINEAIEASNRKNNLIYINGDYNTIIRDVLIINKNDLTITGNGVVFTNEIIVTESSNIRIEELTMRSSNISVPFRLSVHGGENVTIDNCDIAGSVRIIDCLKYNVSNCDIHPLSDHLLLSDAALFVGSTYITEENTYLFNEMIIENNRIHDSPKLGVIVAKVIPTLNSRIHNNRIYLNKAGGIAFSEVVQVTDALKQFNNNDNPAFFSNNFIYDNVPFAITLEQNSFITAKKNTVYGHITGVGIESGARVLFAQNTFYDNEVALILHDGIGTFTNNVFVSREGCVDVLTPLSNGSFSDNKFIVTNNKNDEAIINIRDNALLLIEKNDFYPSVLVHTNPEFNQVTIQKNNALKTIAEYTRDSDSDADKNDEKWNRIGSHPVPPSYTTIDSLSQMFTDSINLQPINELSEDNLQKYSDEGVTLEYPSGWLKENQFIFSDIQLNSANSIKDNIGFQTLIQPISIELAAQRVIDQFGEKVLIEPLTVVRSTVDERKSAIFRVRYLHNNVVMNQVSLIIDGGSCGLKYMFSYTSSHPRYPNMNRFYEILGTMKYNSLLEGPWTTVTHPVFELQVPYMWQLDQSEGIILMFSPIQIVSANECTDNINIQLVKRDYNLLETIVGLRNQLMNQQEFQILKEATPLTIQDKEAMLELVSYAYETSKLTQFNVIIDTGKDNIKILFIYTTHGIWSEDVMWEILARLDFK